MRDAVITKLKTVGIGILAFIGMVLFCIIGLPFVALYKVGEATIDLWDHRKEEFGCQK